jgi:hypothetical protein
MGYTDNPQNFVVDVFKSSVAETWSFKKADANEK